MANLSIIHILSDRVATSYNKMRKIILKLHKSSPSLGFIKKSLFNNITPNLATVKEQFINNNTRTTAKKKLRKIILPNIITILAISNYNMMILEIKYSPILELYLRKC